MLQRRSFLLSNHSLVLAVVIGGLLALLVQSGECGTRDKSGVYARWYAPDSAWAIALVNEVSAQKLEAIAKNAEARSMGFKFVMAVVEEPGVWMTFVMKLSKVKTVTFTKSTKIIVTDKKGKRVESEGVFFWPDEVQSVLYDSRKSPVVVSEKSVWRGPKGELPIGGVKFPKGSIRIGEIDSLEVVGAVENRGG